MFTGIVQEKGEVRAFQEGPQSWRLIVAADLLLRDLAVGDSIAVNGCCLTATEFDSETISFDLLAETVRLTSFAALGPGDHVNLESSLRFNGKIGGHFVSGHVDGVGAVELFEARGKDYYLRVRAPAGFGRYLIYKGSIAIDGVSLTVAEAEEETFAVWLIPHTLEVTTLGALEEGKKVNLEFDLLGKYVERLLAEKTLPNARRA
jgi:riboflavin synthase